MFEHVLPPDICNHRKHRARMNDIRKILIGPDTKINASRLHALLELIDDMKIGSFIRNEIVGVKIAFAFRPLVEVSAELLDTDLNVGGCPWWFGGPGAGAGRQDQCKYKTGKQKCDSVEAGNGRHDRLYGPPTPLYPRKSNFQNLELEITICR